MAEISTSDPAEVAPGAGDTARAHRIDWIVHSRSVGLGVSATRRFMAIDGATQAGLVSIELFTTVIPLIILGFAYAHGFSQSANVGDRFIELLDLTGQRAQDVHDLFGNAQGIHSTWTFIGVAGFLVWGVPMTITVAGMYARAWQRDAYPIGGRLWRGAVWFFAYLATQVARVGAVDAGHRAGTRIMLTLAGAVVLWVFWSLTPVLLVRDGAHGLKALFVAGLAGLLIDGALLGLVGRLVLPFLLGGFTGFGPIGVAMTMMTWCGVVGYGWTATACVTAVLWERSAPLDLVADTNTRDATHRDPRWVAP
ncbi:MAG: hypothetical protein QM733_11400 [Ilumatobacteraceae bacterium]